jgi:hypothetical protein
VLVAYTGCAEAIDWLETRVGSPVTESWGGAAALLGVSWTRIVSWLNRGAATQLMALDALVAYRNPAPNMSPLAQIAAPALPDPPSRSILEDTLAEVLESRNTPRVRKTIERIQHYAHEMLARRTRRVPVEDLPRLYLDPDSFPSAQPILETHEATTSRMRRLLQSVLNRDKLR